MIATLPTGLPRSARTAAPASDTAGSPSRASAWWIPTLPFALLVLVTFNNSPDDALITARYARNILDGLGPVYNPGERVEGFSSPLHLLLTVGVVALPGGLVLLKLKLLSIVFGAGTLASSVLLVRAVGLPRWAQALALLSVGASWNLAVSASNGLETSLVACLTTLLAALVVSGTAAARPLPAAMVAGALAVTRPESVLIVALVGAAAVLHRDDRLWWRRARWLVGPILGFVALLAARLAYYGELLPNTYYAKQGPLLAALWGGVKYAFDVMPWWGTVKPPAVAILALDIGLVAIAVHRIVRTRSWVLLPLVAVLAGQCVFILRAGGDWMNGGRFLAPAIPSLVVLCTLGAVAAVDWLHRRGRWRAGVVVLVATVAAAVSPVMTTWSPLWRGHGVDDRALIAAGNAGPYSRLWEASPDLASCLRAGQTVAFTEAGYFAWALPRATVIDLRGLTDKDIAVQAPAELHGMTGVRDVRWHDPRTVVGRILSQRKPALILSFDGYPVAAPLDGAYRQVETLDWGGPYPVAVYERTDQPCRRG